MTAWPGLAGASPALLGSEGELVSVHISIEPRLLERLLDTLAHLDFPINPDIRQAAGPVTVVEFPAWSARVASIRDALATVGLNDGALTVRGMLEEIRAERQMPLSATA